MSHRLAVLAALSLLLPRAGSTEAPPPAACSACILAHMELLSSDALRGRGSATGDERVAAAYLAAQMRLYGLEPVTGDGSFLQRIDLVEETLSASPRLVFAASPPIELTHGAEALLVQVTGSVSGPLRKLTAAETPGPLRRGDVALLLRSDGLAPRQIFEAVHKAWAAGAVAVLVPEFQGIRDGWQKPATIALYRKGAPRSSENLAVIGDAALSHVSALPDGTEARLEVPLAGPRTRPTWNVVGRVPGERTDEVLLLSSHLDHLGECPPVDADTVCNGADDDASGTTAVMEVARWVKESGRKTRRTLVFALFGSEEIGGHGAAGFRASGVVPLPTIVANLQFEMIGRPDPAVPPHTLWLTGYERSDLGKALRRHGARLVADPRPAEHFFRRSDNYGFALEGVVAHTVSSYGMHPEYHTPKDELSTIDLAHMAEAISSMFEPVLWLATTDWKPSWAPGGQPR